MLLQPFMPVLARPVEGTDASGGGGTTADAAKAKAEFEKSYEKIMAMEPVDLGWLGNATVAVAGFFSGEDYVGQIKEANKQIEEAQAQAKEMKANFDSNNIDKASSMDPNEMVQGALAAQQQAQTERQAVLKSAGQSLQKVGGIIEMIGTILSAVNLVLNICLAFLPAAPAIAAVLAVTEPLAIALPIAGATIKGAGEGLEQAADAGVWSDQELFKYMGREAVKEGVIAGATAVVSEVGGELVSKGVGSIATKYASENADDVVRAVTNAWDPNEMAATVLKDRFAHVLPSTMSEEAVKEVFKNGVDLVDEASSFAYTVATGEGNNLVDRYLSGEDRPTISGGSLAEKGTEALVGGIYDTVVPKPASSKAGLKTGSSYHGGGGGSF